MDTTTIPFRPGDHVADNTVLLELATFLAGDVHPRRRTLTLTWLDAQDRLLGVILPIDDVPARPGPQEASSLGPVLGGVLDDSGGSVVAVLERPGGATITTDDRVWNDALREQSGRYGVRLRGVFVAAGGQVRPLTLDDAR